MPLARATTRSRSPYPPSPRPPTFLPPSHYAVAGGFSFPSERDPYPISTERPGPVSSSDIDQTGQRRGRRESQLANLPMVETQLLPSLRDTIDRMTRPAHQSRSHSPAPSRLPTSPRARTPATQPETPKTPTSKPLKSALRATTPTPAPPPAETTGGSALRSVRSLLRRKSSATKTPEPCAPRLRSRTDPGTNPTAAPVPISMPVTPQPSRQQAFTSNIPRPRAQLSDSSDLEWRYEPKRRLTVANAQVFASSSSSESEVDQLPTPVGPKWQSKGTLEKQFRFAPDVKRQSFVSVSSAESEYHDDDEEGTTGGSLDFDDAAHMRRKAALLGIVNGLQLPDVPTTHDSETEYSGVEGLAISGSRHSMHDPESGSEYDDDEQPEVYLCHEDVQLFQPHSDGSSYFPPPSAVLSRRSESTYDDVTTAAAARERQAFGIPPSESDRVYDGGMIPAESVASDIWYGEDSRDELSEGAEALFRTLGSAPISKPAPTPARLNTVEASGRRQSKLIHADVENSRFESFSHLRDTEAAFVQTMSRVVALFVVPLRVQDSKTWIEGVPVVISRLLDWLEDIVNLHREILGALLSSTRPWEALRALVPRLEIYQPYLVRLAEGVDAIKDDFGEFVKMQEGELSAGWTLEKLLVEPVGRLTGYSALFKQLLDGTPKTHEDYLSILFLLRSTEVMVKALTEVKLREDEYQFTKTISRRIQGLPDIARRDRRLLRHGLVRLAKQDEEQDRSNRLVSAINAWDSNRSRSGSIATASTGSSWDIHVPASPSPLPRRNQGSHSRPHDDMIHLFVFSDLALLVLPLPQDSMTLCEDPVGVARVLDCRDQGDCLTLDLLPILDMKNTTVDPLDARVRLQTVTVQVSQDDKSAWLEAILRSSASSNALLNLAVESACRCVDKSPSTQFDATDMEREERGWWTGRFREVMREVIKMA